MTRLLARTPSKSRRIAFSGSGFARPLGWPALGWPALGALVLGTLLFASAAGAKTRSTSSQLGSESSTAGKSAGAPDNASASTRSASDEPAQEPSTGDGPADGSANESVDGSADESADESSTANPEPGSDASASDEPTSNEADSENKNEGESEGEGEQEDDDTLMPPQPGVNAIGALSVGHPHAGYLFNAVQMPRGDEWLLANPEQAWGTEETVRGLIRCIRHVDEQFADTPRVIVGSISKKKGGPCPPHKSHRTGRDADVYFYLTERPENKWYVPATADNLDRARSWAFLKAIITQTDVQFVLIDKSVQKLLEEHALSIGEDPDWIEDIFHGSGKPYRSVIKHVPGHTGHMHIRFISPIARKRGRRAYDRLVEQGHIEPPVRRIEHEVVPGDTLSGLASKYDTSVDSIRELNELDSSVIKVGQELTIRQQQDIRGARAPVRLPPRRLPQNAPDPDVVATRAALGELERHVERIDQQLSVDP